MRLEEAPISAESRALSPSADSRTDQSLGEAGQAHQGILLPLNWLESLSRVGSWFASDSTASEPYARFLEKEAASAA